MSTTVIITVAYCTVQCCTGTPLKPTTTIFEAKAALHTLTGHQPLDCNLISSTMFEFFLPIASLTQVQQILHEKGLPTSQPILTTRDIPRRAASYNRSRHHLQRQATLHGFPLQLLDLAQQSLHRLPSDRQGKVLSGIRRDRLSIPLHPPTSPVPAATN